MIRQDTLADIRRQQAEDAVRLHHATMNGWGRWIDECVRLARHGSSFGRAAEILNPRGKR